MISFASKKILVTGASSGIGREISIQFSELGAKVVLLARDESRLNETLSMMSGDGHKCISFDLENIEDIKELIQDAVAYDNIKFDGFVHCAGISTIYPLRAVNENKINEIFQVNTYSYLEIIKHLSKKQYSNDKASIVYLSSLVSKKAYPSQALYMASKASSETFAKVLSFELIKRKIRINNVLVSEVATPMMKKTEKHKSLSTSRKEEVTHKNSSTTAITCREVSNMVMFLLSDSANYIIGENYYCDKGYL